MFCICSQGLNLCSYRKKSMLQDEILFSGGCSLLRCIFKHTNTQWIIIMSACYLRMTVSSWTMYFLSSLHNDWFLFLLKRASFNSSALYLCHRITEGWAEPQRSQEKCVFTSQQRERVREVCRSLQRATMNPVRVVLFGDNQPCCAPKYFIYIVTCMNVSSCKVPQKWWTPRPSLDLYPSIILTNGNHHTCLEGKSIRNLPPCFQEVKSAEKWIGTDWNVSH